MWWPGDSPQHPQQHQVPEHLIVMWFREADRVGPRLGAVGAGFLWMRNLEEAAAEGPGAGDPGENVLVPRSPAPSASLSRSCSLKIFGQGRHHQVLLQGGHEQVHGLVW